MLLLVDLDGVVYRGAEPVPGIPALLRDRVERGDTVIYVTNNSRWHRSEYAERLRSMGAPVADDRIVTAARATGLALADGTVTDGRPARLALVLGGPGLGREIRDAGTPTVAATERGLARDPDVVVVGVDFSLSYERLTVAAQAVREGARFVATNRDPVYPTPTRLAAGAGSIVAAVAVAAAREPDLVVGKPEPMLFREAARSVGCDASDAVVIGDSLVTDMAAARAVGARSVLVLTGVTKAHQVGLLPVGERPTAVAIDAQDLARILERLDVGDR